MLNYLAGRFDQMRLLVLTTYRPADMTLAQHPFLAIRDELRAHARSKKSRSASSSGATSSATWP